MIESNPNSTDATLLSRANHTGTQTASTVSDFDVEVANNTAVAANTDKLTANEANVTTALDGAILTPATVAADDKVLVQDTDDSGNLKTVTAQAIADLGGGGSYLPLAGGDLTGALTVTDDVTTPSAVLALHTDDDGSDAGPVLDFDRDSASPTDGDYLGQLKFKGKSDTGTDRTYAKVTAKTSDVTNGSEDGLLEFATMRAGSSTIVARLTGTDLKLENGTDLDVAGDIAVGGTVDGRDIDTDGTKLDGIDAGAKDDQTAAEILALLVGEKLAVQSIGTDALVDKGTVTTGTTIDWNDGNHQKVTLGNDLPLSFTAPTQGCATLTLTVYQDGTGSRGMTLPGTVEWPRGVAPTFSSAASSKDILTFYWDGTAYNASYGPAYA